MSFILLLILDMSCWRNMVLACWFCVALTLVMLHNYITCDVAQLYHLWWFWVFLVFFFSDLYSIPLAPKWDLTGNNHELCTGRVISKVLYSDLLAPECPGLASDSVLWIKLFPSLFRVKVMKCRNLVGMHYAGNVFGLHVSWPMTISMLCNSYMLWTNCSLAVAYLTIDPTELRSI